MNKSNIDSQPSLRVPRSMPIFFAQYIAASFCVYGFTILISILIPTRAAIWQLAASDLTFLSFFSLLPIIIGLSILYFSRQYVMRITYYRDRNVLRIIKRRTSEEININGAVSLNSKIIKQQLGGVKHSLTVKFNDHEFDIFRECAPFGNRWESFSEKLSNITDLPLTKEYWIENYNGGLVQRSRTEHNAGKKRGLMAAIPSLLMLGGSIAYSRWPSRWTFINIGLLVMVCNALIIAIYSRKRVPGSQDQIEKLSVLIPVLLFSSVKIAIIYGLLAFALSGFKLPGVL